MQQDRGDTLAGPGSHAPHGAGQAVSAVPVSIPIAARTHWCQDGPTEHGICLIEIGNRISVELTGSLTSDVPDSEVQQAAELIMAAPALAKLLARLEPHLGAIICYASSTDEHHPNAIAADVAGWLGHLRDCGALPALEGR